MLAFFVKTGFSLCDTGFFLLAFFRPLYNKTGDRVLNRIIMQYTQLFSLLPFQMPDHIQYEKPAGLRQDGFDAAYQGIPIEELSETDATNYAELLKCQFLQKWNSKQEGRVQVANMQQDINIGSFVEFPVPARKQCGEIEELHEGDKAKVKVWVCKEDEIQVYRFEWVPVSDLTVLTR